MLVITLQRASENNHRVTISINCPVTAYPQHGALMNVSRITREPSVRYTVTGDISNGKC